MKTLTNDNKYFIYCRRSSESEDKQVASIEDQLLEMRKVAEQYGLEVVAEITESKSAKKPGREKFNEMLQRMHNGEASGIICWKLNRLARNPIDGGQISWLLQQGIIKHIKTYSGNYYPTDNVIMMAVEMGMANQFVKDLSEDAKRGMRQKAMRGWYPCAQLPAGYMHNPKDTFEAGDKEILKDNKRFAIIRKGWDMLLSGTYSIKSIHKKLADEYGLRNQQGVKYAESTVAGFFKNKFYCGYFDWNDGVGGKSEVLGKHEAMITPEEFDKAQKMFGKKGRPRQYQEDIPYPFRGPLTCGDCGCKITAERKKQCICKNCKYKFSMITRTDCPKCGTDISEMKQPSFIDITYYHCTGRREGCSQKGNMTEKQLSAQVEQYLSSITIPEEFHSWLKAGFQEIHKEEIGNQKELVHAQNRKEIDLVNKLDRYTRMRADNEIDAEQFKKYKSEIEEELTIIKNNRTSHQDRLINWFEVAENYAQFAENALEKFRNGTAEQKKSIVVALGSNLNIKDKNLCVSLPKSLISIKECSDGFFKKIATLEPNFQLVNAKENTSFEMLSFVVLPRQGSNLRPND